MKIQDRKDSKKTGKFGVVYCPEAVAVKNGIASHGHYVCVSEALEMGATHLQDVWQKGHGSRGFPRELVAKWPQHYWA